MQIAHHLTAVAHAQRKSIAAPEKGLEFLARPRVEEDGLGPALACAQDIAVRESAAGGKAPESRKPGPALDDVAHMHVSRLKACAIEGRGHLDLSVHALLAQDRDCRPCATADERRGHVVVRIKAEDRV